MHGYFVESDNIRVEEPKEDSNKLSLEPANDVELRTFLQDSRWIFDNGWVVTFHNDGRIRKSWGVLKPIWKVDKMKALVPAEGHTFRFIDGFTECVWQDEEGVVRMGKLIITR